jgi:hypothetical protein
VGRGAPDSLPSPAAALQQQAGCDGAVHDCQIASRAYQIALLTVSTPLLRGSICRLAANASAPPVLVQAGHVIGRIADGAQDAAVFGRQGDGLAFGRDTQDATTWSLDNRAATISPVSRPARKAKWL